MAELYERTFRSAHRLLHRIAADSGDSLEAVYRFQRLLLRSLLRVEGSLKRARYAVVEGKRDVRRRREGPFAATEARNAKVALGEAEEKVERYEEVRRLLLSFGDGLGFIYINAAEVKQLSKRETAGFIGGKAGLQAELDTLDRLHRLGAVAILNDLTTTLNYGDVTVPGWHNEEYGLIEVKSSQGSNPKREAQLNAIGSFIREREQETAVAPWGETMPKEFLILGRERFYAREVEAIVLRAFKCGFAAVETEPGQSFLAFRPEHASMMKEVGPRSEGSWALVLQPYRPLPLGHPPLCLTVADFDVWWLLASRRLILVCVVDADRLRELLDSAGLKFEFIDDEEYFLRISQPAIDKFFLLATARYLRLVTEFQGLSSFVEGVSEIANGMRVSENG